MPNVDQLDVYHRSHELELDVYRHSRDLPTDERFGLITQMRRSAMSIPMNLAEGCGRGTDRELARFAAIAQGSAAELHYQVTLSEELGYLDARIALDLRRDINRIRKMLHGLRSSLSR